jgi:hypothetical protein
MPRTMQLESLETREVPATFGTPWLDGDLITVSFAPDTTAKVDGVASQLKKFMNANGLTESVWQGEILRAMQTWTNEANINFGVVADNGAKIGTTGSFQGDGRFGDIRIFAIPLSSNVIAITSPPDQLAGTRAGDIILNSNLKFTVGGANGTYDLYSVMLQEVGHALGIASNSDPASPMYHTYNGVRTKLTSADIDAVRGLYGYRSYNFFEYFGNNSSSSATSISEANLLANKTTVTLIGDLDLTTDDWYKFTFPSGVGDLTIELQTGGYSLAQGALSLFNASQTMMATSSAIGPGKNVSLKAALTPGNTYFIRVSDAVGTAFTSGLYRLRLIPKGSISESVSLAGLPNYTETNLNNTPATATPLLDLDPTAWRTYSVIASLPVADVDNFKVVAPSGTQQERVVLTAAIRAYAGVVAPQILVLSSTGAVLPATAAADGNGFYAVEFDDAVPGETYIVKVQHRTGVIPGLDYKLDVSFRNLPKTISEIFSGTTTSTATTLNSTLSINRSVMMAFDLTAAFSTGDGFITMTIHDANNKAVFSLVAGAGDTVAANVFLNAGSYTVSYKVNRVGATSSVATIDLAGAVLTDPIGVTSSTAADYSYTTSDKLWTRKTYYTADLLVA